jgi:propanediol dehydratase small subunit
MWAIKVDGLRGATQAKSAREIDAMARDFIAELTGVTASRVKVETEIELPSKVKSALDKAEKLRIESDLARKAAAQEYRLAAQLLKDEGMTVRDIGAALGVAFQRAQQLLKH